MKNYLSLLLLAIIVFAALFLRLWGVIHGNIAFTYDTGRDLLAVRDFIYLHKLSLLGPTTGQIGIFYGPWWYWFLTIPFVIFGGNPLRIACFIVFVAGICPVILAYWWGKHWKNEFFGLMLAGILAVGPFFVGSTSQIWSPDILIILTLSIMALLSYLPKLKTSTLLLLGFLSVLLSEFEMVYGIIFILGLVIALLLWQRKTIFSAKGLVILLGGVIVEIPRLLFELRHGFGQTKILFRSLTGLDSALGKSNYLNLFWEKTMTLVPGNQLIWQVGFWLLVAVLIGFGWRKLPRAKQIFLKICLTIVSIFFLAGCFYPREFWQYYLYGLPVILAILAVEAWSSLGKNFPVKFVYLLAGIYLIVLLNPVREFAGLRQPIFTGDAALYRNEQEVMRYIFDQAGEDFNYIAYTPPQIDYTWQYLFWWWNRKNLGFGQTTVKKVKMFVIIEPDPGYPDRIKEWLKLRQDDGIIVKEQCFASGIVVQTRLREVDTVISFQLSALRQSDD